MRLTLLIATPVLLGISACTPDRSLTTAAPYWPGEYRDGYNNGDYIPTLAPRHDESDSNGASYSSPDKESDDLNN
jgi:hypothetical protein